MFVVFNFQIQFSIDWFESYECVKWKCSRIFPRVKNVCCFWLEVCDLFSMSTCMRVCFGWIALINGRCLFMVIVGSWLVGWLFSMLFKYWYVVNRVVMCVYVCVFLCNFLRCSNQKYMNCVYEVCVCVRVGWFLYKITWKKIARLINSDNEQKFTVTFGCVLKIVEFFVFIHRYFVCWWFCRKRRAHASEHKNQHLNFIHLLRMFVLNWAKKNIDTFFGCTK